ncbi:MAG: BON domain-containing protein [Pirellulaceae bacterium]
MIEPTSPFQQEIESALSGSPHLGSRTLRIENEEGRIVLKGTVNSYFQKQMAQEAIRGVRGISEIENQLEVAWT